MEHTEGGELKSCDIDGYGPTRWTAMLSLMAIALPSMTEGWDSSQTLRRA